MTWWTRLFRRKQLEDELDAELRDHLGHQTDEYRRHGIDAAEAHRRARADLGQLDGVKDDCRQAWGLRLFDELRSDLRFGVRGLARNPGFTATAALTLMIGIGGTAAIFSVASAFLFRPFPAPDPEQLVVVAQVDERSPQPHQLSYPEYLDYRDRNQVLEGLAAYRFEREFLSTTGAAQPVWVEYVSRDFFEVLRVDASLGRTFLPDEGRQPGDAPVVVLSHRAWQNRFGADPAVVGSIVSLGSAEHTVIGVTPEWFAFTDTLLKPELYVPVTQLRLDGVSRADLLTDRNVQMFWLMGRLRPGVTVAEARANLSVLTTVLATEYPDSREHTELWLELERRARPAPTAAGFLAPALTMVMAMALLVLLIACANVATLLIGRGFGRQREMALRAGLGATRRRLVRQLLGESVLLALLGGSGGALVALWATDLLSTVDLGAAVNAEVILDMQMDWRAFAFTAVTATLTGVITGLAPARRTTRVDLTSAIGKSARGASPGAAGRLTSGLVAAQVAMSLVLLVCAGLFVRSGQHATDLDFGFRTDELLLLSVDPLPQGYAQEQARGFYRDVANEVAALPGVRSVSWARVAPQAIGPTLTVVTPDGPATDPVSMELNYVDPAYFATVDVPVMRGRGFSEGDALAGRPVTVINETAARQLWPGEDPLGRPLSRPTAVEAPYEVIGVVRDARLSYDITRVPAAMLLPFGRNLVGPATLHIHTEGPPTALAPAVTAAVRRRDPTLWIFGLDSVANLMDGGFFQSLTRMGATVVGAFGALGLLLAAVGLYGVVAYSVTQRLREFGIRTALGATAAGIVQLALGRAMILTGIGLVLGALAAAAVTPFITGYLLDVNPTDPVVFGVTGLLLAGVALLACLVPSRRATKADPLAALNVD
ncbi:MAG: ABC transporter permease [Vicinamibacterales bacterium]